MSNKINKAFGDIWCIFVFAHLRNNQLSVLPIPEDGETLADTRYIWVFMEYTVSRFVVNQ